MARYNQTARPFSWKFTASDLHDLMDRISKHNQQDPRDKPLPHYAGERDRAAALHAPLP